MFFEANSFRNSYITKIEQLRNSLGTISDEVIQPCCIVLLSFACELYLKLLYCLEKIENGNNIEFVEMEKGHELNVLFNRLTFDSKNLIEKKQIYQQRRYLMNLMSIKMIL